MGNGNHHFLDGSRIRNFAVLLQLENDQQTSQRQGEEADHDDPFELLRCFDPGNILQYLFNRFLQGRESIRASLWTCVPLSMYRSMAWKAEQGLSRLQIAVLPRQRSGRTSVIG